MKTKHSLPKRKMQNVSFRDINDFLDFLPKDELAIVECIRDIIFNCSPNISEKLSFNVPFYTVHKNVFFLWPASVLWGKKKTYEGVRLGFSYGYLMSDPNGILEQGDRKQVCYLDIRRLTDIDTSIIRSYILEALFIDEQQFQIKQTLSK